MSGDNIPNDSCAICAYISEAFISLKRISDCIGFSCNAQTKQREFGLDKSFIDRQVAVVSQIKKYHSYYHITGEALMDSNTQVQSPEDKRKRRGPDGKHNS